MKRYVVAIVLALALAVGFVAGRMTLASYAIANAGTHDYAGFYRVNVRTGAVRGCFYHASAWHCSDVTSL